MGALIHMIKTGMLKGALKGEEAGRGKGNERMSEAADTATRAEKHRQNTLIMIRSAVAPKEAEEGRVHIGLNARAR